MLPVGMDLHGKAEAIEGNCWLWDHFYSWELQLEL